ncbi:MAG: tetraacyldisaccharide 4'-kinase, partial [Comamonadaceae bacterium]
MNLSLAAIWRERGWRARALLPVTALYGWVSALQRGAYRWGWKTAHRIRVPVVVVGNVIAGGAGKTPVVIALAQHLGRRGFHIGVISRGHGRQTTDARLVDASCSARDVGDEPLLIWRRTGVPVAVALRRVDAATALLDAWPNTDVILSDDGLQHLGLARDIEVCVFDDRGIGNGWLLPAGPLREPWPRNVDLVLHTGAHPAFSGFRSRRVLGRDAVDSRGATVPLTVLAKE